MNISRINKNTSLFFLSVLGIIVIVYFLKRSKHKQVNKNVQDNMLFNKKYVYFVDNKEFEVYFDVGSYLNYVNSYLVPSIKYKDKKIPLIDFLLLKELREDANEQNKVFDNYYVMDYVKRITSSYNTNDLPFWFKDKHDTKNMVLYINVLNSIRYKSQRYYLNMSVTGIYRDDDIIKPLLSIIFYNKVISDKFGYKYIVDRDLDLLNKEDMSMVLDKFNINSVRDIKNTLSFFGYMITPKNNK